MPTPSPPVPIFLTPDAPVCVIACLLDLPPGKGKEASAMQANWLSKGGLKAYPIAPSFWWKQIWFFIILHLVSWTEKGFWKIKCQFLLIKNSNQIFFRCANILALDHHILFLHIRIQWWSVHFLTTDQIWMIQSKQRVCYLYQTVSSCVKCLVRATKPWKLDVFWKVCKITKIGNKNDELSSCTTKISKLWKLLAIWYIYLLLLLVQFTENVSGLLTKCMVKMAGYWSSSFYGLRLGP